MPVVEPHLPNVAALVSAINGHAWTTTEAQVVAADRYVERLDADRDETIRVFVFPGDLATARAARSGNEEIHTTWFIVAVDAPDKSPNAINPLVTFCRELRETAEKVDLPYGSVLNLVTGDLYDFDALNSDALFLQIFGLRWRYPR